MKIYYIMSIFLVLIVVSLKAKLIEKEVFIRYSEECINNITFKHRIDIENGNKKELYSINGAVVTDQDYEEAILEAEKEEIRVRRKKEEEARSKLYKLYHKAQTKSLLHDFKLEVKALDDEVKKISDERLKPYLIFGEGILSHPEKLDYIVTDLLPQAYALLRTKLDDIDISKIKKISHKVQKAIPQVQDTFFATVNNAIDKGNDTQLLKELLVLLN